MNFLSSGFGGIILLSAVNFSLFVCISIIFSSFVISGITVIGS